MTPDANNPAIEDDDLGKTAPNPIDDDLNTTAPNPIEDDLSTTAPNPPDEPAWTMPVPVFRKTSGRLPQGYERDVMDVAEAENSVPPAGSASPPSPAAPASEPVIKPKSSVLKLILVLLGIGAMTAFLIVFLTVVYYFFMR